MKNRVLALAQAVTLGLAMSTAAHAAPTATLEVLGTYNTGIFDEGAAEIVAYDARRQQIFVINANDTSIDVLDISDPSSPDKVDTIDASLLGGGVNSVAIYKNIVAAAIEGGTKQEDGIVAFFMTHVRLITSLRSLSAPCPTW